MTEKQFTRGDWTTCVYDVCEINKDGEVFCTVATRDVDLIISVLEENEQLKSEIEELENENEKLENKLWNCQNVR